MSREAFERKFPKPNALVFNDGLSRYDGGVYTNALEYNAMWNAWKAAQAQAGQPIAAVHGWFHGECVIRAIDPEVVLTVGMALYSQPQAKAQAGDGEAFCDANCTWLDHHKDCKVLPLVWMRTEDVPRTMIATEGERAEVAPDKEGDFDVPLYRHPQPAQVNQQLLEALQVCEDRLSFLLNDRAPTYATEQVIIKARAAIAAAQENKL